MKVVDLVGVEPTSAASFLSPFATSPYLTQRGGCPRWLPLAPVVLHARL